MDTAVLDHYMKEIRHLGAQDAVTDVTIDPNATLILTAGRVRSATVVDGTGTYAVDDEIVLTVQDAETAATLVVTEVDDDDDIVSVSVKAGSEGANYLSTGDYTAVVDAGAGSATFNLTLEFPVDDTTAPPTITDGGADFVNTEVVLTTTDTGATAATITAPTVTDGVVEEAALTVTDGGWYLEGAAPVVSIKNIPVADGAALLTALYTFDGAQRGERVLGALQYAQDVLPDYLGFAASIQEAIDTPPADV